METVTSETLLAAANKAEKSQENLKKAAELAGQIEKLQAELNTLLLEQSLTVETKSRVLSPEARQKISDGQKRRWEKVRLAKESVAPAVEAVA